LCRGSDVSRFQWLEKQYHAICASQPGSELAVACGIEQINRKPRLRAQQCDARISDFPGNKNMWH
jgi:hypothetical protein